MQTPVNPSTSNKRLLSYDEYYELITSPTGEAALENRFILFQNIENRFSGMDNSTEQIITIPKAIHEEAK